MRLKVSAAQKEDVYKDIIRVSEQYRRDYKGRLIPEGTVCLIQVNSKKLYTILRGNLEGGKKEILIDERLRNRLNLNVGDEVDFIFKKSGLWGEFSWAWNASDPAYRICARLGLISVIIGIIALVISLFTFL